MAIEFILSGPMSMDIYVNKFKLGVIHNNHEGLWFQTDNKNAHFTVNTLEQILSKMKELQGGDKV